MKLFWKRTDLSVGGSNLTVCRNLYGYDSTTHIYNTQDKYRKKSKQLNLIKVNKSNPSLVPARQPWADLGILH